MKRIDTWLDIKKYIDESARAAAAVIPRPGEVEMFARASRRKRERGIIRRTHIV
ncbi:MAG: hypothetical protein JO019_02455 [Candidatus Kaiserbacteria bacterium]|nr:hypothetical protein [Candidatus Kaiserbacteria bacterium]